MAIPAHKNVTNPPGQIRNELPESYGQPESKTLQGIVNPWPWPEKKLGDIIDRVQRSEAPAMPENPPAMRLAVEGTEVYQQGYAAGYVDGKAEGFRDALAVMNGKI